MTCYSIAGNSELLRKVKWGEKKLAKYLNNLCCFMQLQCSLHWNTVLYWDPVKVSPGWLKSLWVTSLKSLLPGTDLLLTFNRVRIPCITVFSLFASVVASDTVYPNLSCYLSLLVRLLPRCVQTSQWFELKVQAVALLSRSPVFGARRRWEQESFSFILLSNSDFSEKPCRRVKTILRFWN